MTEHTSNQVLKLTAQVVAAYVSRNAVPQGQIGEFISATHAALTQLVSGAEPTPSDPPAPAVPVRKSVTHEAIICLEDGRPFRSLKRHLRTQYGMTADQYREKWGLPPDYPMVAPSYSEIRSALAKANGLGRQSYTGKRRQRSSPIRA